MEDWDIDNYEPDESDDTFLEPHEEPSMDSFTESDEMYDRSNDDDEFDNEPLNEGNTEAERNLSFQSAHYNKDEIENLRQNYLRAEDEVKRCKTDVANWESKVSLNDTKENRLNGNYDNALNHLEKAKRRLYDATWSCKEAKIKYNNAR